MSARPYRAPTRQAANEERFSFTPAFWMVIFALGFWTVLAATLLQWDALVQWANDAADWLLGWL